LLYPAELTADDCIMQVYCLIVKPYLAIIEKIFNWSEW